MPRYRVTKVIKAKNLKTAVTLEPQATSIEEIEEEVTERTPAMGFHIPYQPDLESYDPNP
jgi:hypothetical protein